MKLAFYASLQCEVVSLIRVRGSFSTHYFVDRLEGVTQESSFIKNSCVCFRSEFLTPETVI